MYEKTARYAKEFPQSSWRATAAVPSLHRHQLKIARAKNANDVNWLSDTRHHYVMIVMSQITLETGFKGKKDLVCS